MAYKGLQPKAGSGQIPSYAQARKEVPIVIDVRYHILTNPKALKTNIREGIPVDYDICSPELVRVAIQSISQHLCQLCLGFSWDFSAMTLCEESTWQDVLQKNPLVTYFQGRFLKIKPSAKSDGIPYFAAPSKAVDFVLVIEQDQWLVSEQFMERSNEQIDSDQSQISLFSQKRKTPPSPVKVPSVENKKILTLSRATMKSWTAMSVLSDTSLSGSGFRNEGQANNSTAKSSAPAAHIRRFKPIEATQIRKGISIGEQNVILGQKLKIDSKITETVACFTINPVPFADISVDSMNLLIQINDHSKYLGYLCYDLQNPNDFLGKGAFKTAHVASLKWLSASPSGDVLGGNMTYFSSPLQVAMKQPYFNTQKGIQKQYGYASEAQHTLTEATLLGYALSLLCYLYNFIDDFINHTAESSPLFSIPRLCFVKGVIAYSEKPLQEGLSNRLLLSHCSAYLLEELLPKDAEFIKYIHNAEAVPLLDSVHSEYKSSVFLCFIQHLQYIQTHGQVYLSDFQGMDLLNNGMIKLLKYGAGNLLMDPQIMTHLSLASDNKEFFGEGNIDMTFNAFPLQHECNRYCQWFKLELFLSVSTSKHNQESDKGSDQVGVK